MTDWSPIPNERMMVQAGDEVVFFDSGPDEYEFESSGRTIKFWIKPGSLYVIGEITLFGKDGSERRIHEGERTGQGAS